MAKRNSDGDVLSNRVSLGLANSQKRLALLLGRAPESHATSIVNQEPDEEEEDFRKEYVNPEQYVYRLLVPSCSFNSLLHIGLALVAYAPKTSKMVASPGEP